MYSQLQNINQKPKAFEFYTTDSLWTEEHRSRQMLSYHLNQELDLASRNKDFIHTSIAWIINRFKLDQQSKVCDFGCGPGLYTSGLAASGADITGIDFSQNSLRYARQYAQENHLTIQYIQENYLHYETSQQYDLILMIMCDYCSLSPLHRTQLLNKFKRLLKPDGAILFDVYSLHGFAARNESAFYQHNQLNGFWSEKDYYAFVNIIKYEEEKVILDKYTIVDEHDTQTFYNWAQYFNAYSLSQELKHSGLKLVNLYADVAGSIYQPEDTEFAIIAEKC